MKKVQASSSTFSITLCIIAGLLACQQEKPAIKKSTFEITPIQSEIFSKDEHVSITVNDTLDLNELGLCASDLFDYNIYLYVHPLNAEGWWRQNPATASKRWIAQAYLGGVGEYSAKEGEVFQIVAVMAIYAPAEKVDDLRIFRDMKDVYFISELRMITVRRK